MWSSAQPQHAHATEDDDDDDDDGGGRGSVDVPPDFELDGRAALHGGRLTRAEAVAIAAAEESRRPRRPFSTPFSADYSSGGSSNSSSNSSSGYGNGNDSVNGQSGGGGSGGDSPSLYGYGGQTPMNTPAPSSAAGKPSKCVGGGCRRIGTACILLVLLAETLLVLFALGNRSASTQPCANIAGSGADVALSSAPPSLQAQQQQLLLQRVQQMAAQGHGVERADLVAAAAAAAALSPAATPDVDPLIRQMLAHKFDPTAVQQLTDSTFQGVNPDVAVALTQPDAAHAIAPAPAAPAPVVAGQRVIPQRMPVLADKLGTVQASRPMGPLLVTGSHRSGSSWLGATLMQAHPSLCYVDEPFHATHQAPASPFPRWFFYIPEWMRRTPTRFPADTNTPPPELDRLVSAKPVTQPFALTPNGLNWPKTKADIAALAAAANLNVPAGEDKALYFHPLVDMERVNAYLDVSVRCQLKAAPKQYPLYIRLVKQRLRKTSASIPLLKDPIALFSTPYLAKTYGTRPILLVRHPAAFIDSLVRPHWGFDWKDLTGQPWLMEDLLAPYAEEIRAAEKGEFPHRYTEPYPSPQKSEFPGWLKFPGHAFEFDPKAKPVPQPHRGKPLAAIVKALEADTSVNAFVSDGTVRSEAGARGGWLRKKSQDDSTLYVRESKHQDLIEAGILLWRVFYGVVARFRLEHPDWMVVRYEDLVRDRNTHFAKLFDYAGMPFGPEARRRLADMKFPRGIDHFRQTFTWQELAHIKHRTRDVWTQFYTDEDWFGADLPGAQRMEFVKK